MDEVVAEDKKIKLETVSKENGLQKLLDPSYPLLKKFRDICSGSYKHSQSLCSMVEGLATDLNLNVNKLKVAALYHDIGKMNFPKCFSENQLEGENIHDNLEPIISYQLITRHVGDSISILLNDDNFPIDIIKIISQHHGTTILKYFFKKSKLDDGKIFRYKTAKPSCMYSALLMICDQVEATSRSKPETEFNPLEIIENTINDLIDDGQLDEVIMKLGDLKKIKRSLAKELEGMYQKRVDYSELDKEK